MLGDAQLGDPLLLRRGQVAVDVLVRERLLGLADLVGAQVQVVVGEHGAYATGVVHLRIVVPSHTAEHALDLLKATPSVCNLVYLERAAQKPEGDVILCDVAREDASVIVSDLKEFGIQQEGSIAMEDIDSMISDRRARRGGGRGAPSDAVVWEEVEARTSENTELSASFLLFMVLACLIASVGILLDSPILIIGAMVVGPEFGPLAGLCVAIVQRRPELIKRSLLPLVIGFPLGITASYLFTLLIDAAGLTPEGFSAGCIRTPTSSPIPMRSRSSSRPSRGPPASSP